MLKLFPVYKNNPYLPDILSMLFTCRALVFDDTQNLCKFFLLNLYNNKIRVIGATCDDKLIGFAILYDFHKISDKEFYCYISGSMKRNFANKLDKAFEIISESLKKQGCVAIRFETKNYNMPMRFCARRLGFNRVGIFHKAAFCNGKYVDNIIYEKIL